MMKKTDLLNYPYTLNAYQWNLVGWVCYWIVFNVYCIFWREYALPNVYSFLDSNVWFVKEWVAWLVLSQALIYYLRHLHTHLHLLVKLVLGAVVCLGGAIGVRALFNSGEYPISPIAISVILLPKYASAYCIVVACWLFFEGLGHRESEKSQQGAGEAGELISILVEHRGLSLSLRASDIISMKAAGNYVEIGTENETYLKRTTLTQLLEELPEQRLMRVHRSYAINLDKLQGLVNTENGAAIATLTNGLAIPVSKRYKSALKKACHSV